MLRKLFLLGVIGSFLVLPVSALADSIDPTSVSATISVDQSIEINKTVTITEDVTTSLVDVFFLFDTTGSMGAELALAQETAGDVLSGISGLGSAAYGVGYYEDFPISPFGGSGDVEYELVQDITTDATLAEAAINSLELGFGNDTPESNLHALTEVANETNWRDGSSRIVLWFGDAPGHEGDEPGYPSDATTENTIAALQGENISVVGIDYFGLDSTGQATSITDDTGGLLVDGTTASSAAFIALIEDAISDVFETYETVELSVDGDTTGLDIEISPAAYSGEFSRTAEETFEFLVTITGEAPGTYSFLINALVDGGIVATESDRIIVAGDGETPVPEPATLLLLGLGILGLAGLKGRFIRKS